MTDKVVRVQQGLLQGCSYETVDGEQYLAFMGVPYAEPPVGKLRFKDPKPHSLWKGIRDATKESPKSLQADPITRNIEGGDDCLYLNIVTSGLCGKKAVIVWVHGGGFSVGSNNFDQYSPDYLVKKDIVFVGINYRLGALGFLNMGHKDCSGNQGLKDQIAAIKWVRQNIEAFGGDSNNITVMGESAGSVCVHLLCLSPLSKGLFHKVILQSGVSLNPWTFLKENKNSGYDLAEALGEECCDADEVLEFLRTVPAKRFVEAWEKLRPHHMLKIDYTFVPTIDDKSEAPFLTRPPSELMSQGIDIPVLIGHNTHEAIIYFMTERPDIIKKFNSNFEKCMYEETKLNKTSILSELPKNVRNFYFGSDVITDQKVDSLVQFYSDVKFINGIQQVVEVQMKKTSPTYMYRFSYVPNGTMKTFFKLKVPGTCHADELGCLFYSHIYRRGEKFDQSSKDYRMLNLMTTMWTNFAKSGNPTPEVDDTITTLWPPVTKDQKNYLEIGDYIMPGIHPGAKSWNLWKKAYCQTN